MSQPSPTGKLTKEDLLKTSRTALFGALATAGVTILQSLQVTDLGSYTPIAVILSTIALDFLNRWLRNKK